MIIRLKTYAQGGKTMMEIHSKPKHQRGEHEVAFEGEADAGLLKKLKGKTVAYFHAHMRDDQLVIDDEVLGQTW